MTSTSARRSGAVTAAILVLALGGGGAGAWAVDGHSERHALNVVSRPGASMRADSVQVTADRFAGHVEPDVAVNPRHRSNLFGACQFEIGTRQRLPGTFVSFDGGRSWHDNGLLSLATGYDQGADTTVAFARDGTGYVAALLSHGGNGYASRVTRGGIFLWRTGNGGRSFSKPIPVYVGPGFQDHPWLAIRDTPRGAILYLAWTNRSGLVFTRSRPGSTVFAQPRLLVAGSAPSTPVLVTGPGADLEIFLQASHLDKRGGKLQAMPATLAVLSSSNGGDTFSTAQTIGRVTIAADPASQQPPPLLAAAADPNKPVSGVAIAAQDRQSGHPVIELWQRDGASGRWRGPTRPVTGRTAALAQEQPRLAYANGYLYISYFTITRGGTIREQLTRAPESSMTFGPQRSFGVPFGADGFIGDYQALAVAGKNVYLLWNDGRSRRLEIVAAHLTVR